VGVPGVLSLDFSICYLGNEKMWGKFNLTVACGTVTGDKKVIVFPVIVFSSYGKVTLVPDFLSFVKRQISVSRYMYEIV